jgi:hypothetical protein
MPLTHPNPIAARTWRDSELVDAAKLNTIRDDLKKLRPIGVKHYDEAIGLKSVPARAAFQAAIDDAEPGGFLYAPRGAYFIESPGLVIDKPLTIVGDGCRSATQAPFGDTSWDTDHEEGTVLVTDMTEGAVITYTAGATSGATGHQFFGLRDLMVKGIGDARRTAVGIRIGTPETFWEQSVWSNVEVCNMAAGIHFRGGVFDNEFRSLRIRGCDVAIRAAIGVPGSGGTEFFNQNTFYQFVIDVCNSGFRMGAVDAQGPLTIIGSASKNAFYGGLISNVTTPAGWGIDIGFGEENTFYDVYMENGPAFTGHAIRVQLGDFNKFLDFHIGTAMDVEFNGSGNIYRPAKYSFGQVRLLGAQNRVEGNHHGNLLLKGLHNVFARQTEAGETFTYGSVGSPGSNTGGAKYEGADILQLQLVTAGGRQAVLGARDDMPGISFRIHYVHPREGTVEVVNIDESKTVHVGPESPGSVLALRSADGITVNRGITFPAAPVASTDPNTFDDYQEGEWTPGLIGGNGNSGQSVSFSAGTFTKQGNRCSISGRIALTARGRFAGPIILTGLPFPSGGPAGGCAGCLSVGRAQKLSGDLIALSGTIGGGASGFTLDGFDTKTFLSRNVAQDDLTDATDLWFVGEYRTAT